MTQLDRGGTRALAQKLWLSTAAVTCAVAITACGSSGSQPSAQAPEGSNQSATLVKFAECMRSHGASGFPDPR
jgi:hypothetical protein